MIIRFHKKGLRAMYVDVATPEGMFAALRYAHEEWGHPIDLRQAIEKTSGMSSMIFFLFPKERTASVHWVEP